MKGLKSLKADVVLKDFWRDSGRFADLFNQVLFHGREVLRPELLVEADTDMSVSMGGESGSFRTLDRTRDIVKKTAGDVEFVLYGIENQLQVHYAMPLRCCIYDALSYVRQCGDIEKARRKEKGLKTSGEFLSGMKREDRLNLVVSVVIYYGEKPWDGPRCLSDMIHTGDLHQPFLNDYVMNLVEVNDVKQYHFANKDVKIFFDLINQLYSRMDRFEKLKMIEERFGEQRIDRDILLAVIMASGDKKLVEKIQGRERDVAMCTFFDELRKDWMEEDMEQGVARGIVQGMEQGMEQGKSRVNLLIQLLAGQTRMDEIIKMSGDIDYQQKLFDEFGI